jgi:hypothetical protein
LGRATNRDVELRIVPAAVACGDHNYDTGFPGGFHGLIAITRVLPPIPENDGLPHKCYPDR